MQTSPLPDAAPLAALPPETLRALGSRLRTIGLDRAFLRPTDEAVRGLHRMLRRPIRAFHLRKQAEPAAWAARMTMFGDPVREEEARAALADLFDPLRAAGLLEVTSRGALSRLVLSLVEDLYLFADELGHGRDAVLAPTDTAVALAKASLPEVPVSRALDLGCGSGVCGLLLARRAAHVIATDSHPRALALSRFNAAINGVDNIELREGDLFAPVAGETFDLVVACPPFLPGPPDSAATSLLDAGRRGDERALALLAGVSPHLAEQGRALFSVEWPVTDKAPVAGRLRAAVGEGPLDLLVLAAPMIGPAEHATEHAQNAHAVLGEAFEKDVALRLAHFERTNVRGVEPTLAILQRASRPTGWTDTLPISPRALAHATSARIDRLLAARAIQGDRDKLLALRVRMPEGTALIEEQKGPGADVPSTLQARFADDALIEPVGMTPEMLALVSVLQESDTVESGIAHFAESYEVPLAAATAKVLPAVEQALRQGFLEIR